MIITVFTKPHCVQCDATKRALDKAGAQYDTVDITTDADALEKFKAMGFASAPVVTFGEDVWAGYNPAKIKAAVAAQQSPALELAAA